MAASRMRGLTGQAGGTPWRSTAVLLALGGSVLALGLLVYLSDRPAGRAALVPPIARWAAGPHFGAIGQWLPSFVHALGFGLLSAALLPAHRRARQAACVDWGLVDIAFELGQHPRLSRRLAELIPDHVGDLPLARYFTHGSFDPGDILAAMLGAAVALAVLRRVDSQEVTPWHR